MKLHFAFSELFKFFLFIPESNHFRQFSAKAHKLIVSLTDPKEFRFQHHMHCYGSMSSQLDPGEVTEDLKAFERRLTEYISGLHPKAVRWRIVLAVSSVCTVVSAWYWITDEDTAKVTLLESLWYHKFFSTNIISFILLLLMGVHKRVREPQTILKRCRLVLEDYNMSCDDNGRLILRPRPPS